MATKQEWK